MADPNTNGPATAPESTAGLALILGETRSELRHQAEETARRFDGLNATLAGETAAREDAVAALETRVAELTALLQKTVEAVTATTDTMRPSKPVTTETASPDAGLPVRARNEKNRGFHTRLVAWARKQGISEPPKPKASEFTNAYNKRIAAWVKENVPERAA